MDETKTGLMELQFLGAAQTVTGSKYLIKAAGFTVLIDCGLYQGKKDLRLRNWNTLPIDPAEIDFVILTHAHIDHSGYIPLLVKSGFTGTIFCTAATLELCEILLPDCGYLQEEQAKFLNQHGGSKHQPAKPLYTLAEAKQSLNYFKVVPFAEPVILSDSLQFSFYYAGHILGAGFVRLQHKQTSICFSGDLGRSNDPIMKAPQAPVASDYFVVESTYGNRLHEQVDPERQLAHIINRVAKRNGVIVVPAFAVGRAQAVLYFLHQLKLKKQIPDIPVYLDSPMATDATKIFYQHSEQHRLSEQETVAVCQTTRYVKLQEESKALDQQEGPMIIISASGMATGGRVLHHLRSFASDANNAIVFCGFQAPGTRGDRLVQGERQIKLLGETIPVLAEVHQLQNTSAHADYQGMTEWLAKLKHKPKKVFITHGENAAAEGLKQQLETTLNLSCVIPHYLDKQVLR